MDAPSLSSAKAAADLTDKVNVPLTESQVHKVFASREFWVRERAPGYGVLERQVTPQDRILYALCRRKLRDRESAYGVAV